MLREPFFRGHSVQDTYTALKTVHWQPVMINQGFLSSLLQPVKYSTEREIYRLIQPCNLVTTESLFCTVEKAAGRLATTGKTSQWQQHMLHLKAITICRSVQKMQQNTITSNDIHICSTKYCQLNLNTHHDNCTLAPVIHTRPKVQRKKYD